MTLTLDPTAIDLATLRKLWQGTPAKLDDASMERKGNLKRTVRVLTASWTLQQASF